MATLATLDRTTSSDQIFEDLYGKITKLEYLPGTKLSETEVAKTFGVSRQPVREAFARLANMNLLLIRPQRATIVRPFSREIIANARFTRAAMEQAVLRVATEDRDRSVDAEIKHSLQLQGKAIAEGDAETFHKLDYEFHQLICKAARKPFAFEIIAANKAQVDRLCMLSLTSKEAMETLFADHELLVEAILDGKAAVADKILLDHLDRLTPTIDAIYATHRTYFDV